MRPSTLPKARRQLLRHLDSPGAPIRANTGDDVRPGLDRLASHLRVGDMYWVAQDMAALAVSAGGQLAAARWATADRPSPCGLLWWGDGIGSVPYAGSDFPVDAVSWGPSPDGQLLVWMLLHRRRVEEALAVTGAHLKEGGVPPLVPIAGFQLPVSVEPVPLAELGKDSPETMVRALAAAWLLMQQPLLIDRQRERGDAGTRRAYARDGLPQADVTVVDLRRQYTPQDRDPDAETDGRSYRHRWVVSGHWRNQAYGPGQSLRRQTWVPSYVKGSEGAPLLSTEKVNVWRR
jgi:hypothetical protein